MTARARLAATLALVLCTGCASSAEADRAARAHAEAELARHSAASAAAAQQSAVEAEALAHARLYINGVNAAPKVMAQADAGAKAADVALADQAAASKAAVAKARAEEQQRVAQAAAAAEAAKALAAADAAAAAASAAQASAAASNAAKSAAATGALADAAKSAAADATKEATATATAAAAAHAASAKASGAITAPVNPADYAGLVAEIQTSKGAMVLAFRADKAPGHVKNFVDLAKAHFYDGLSFHRIIPDYIIQGGDPKGDGSGGPGYHLKAEFNDLPHLRGTLSMSHGGHPDSGGSQFFICQVPIPKLDGKFTVFGMLVKGWDTLDAIAAVGSVGGTPGETVTITKVVIRPAQADETL